MEQIRTNGEQKELRDEVVDLGTRYGIVTPYTSYLALESDEATQVTAGNRPANGRRRDNNFSLGGADASAAPGATSAARAPVPKEAARATTGAVAVQQSKRDRAQQETIRVEAEASSGGMRSVGGKTFYLREGVWTDAEFKAEARVPETTLVFGSDEYFALLKREPRLADFFALGERVVVLYQGRVYRVTTATK
jgi:Ca-activated chloride channel family protein